jgi:SAM-dependent methyltransferase
MKNASTLSNGNSQVHPSVEVTCGCCGSSDVEVVYETRNVPTNSCILLPTVAEATGYPRGDIRLGFCKQCGFLSNVAFDNALTEYSGRYEETQAFSPTFNKFHEQLVHSLIEKHDLHDKDVLEIGCGKGEFLNLICEAGENRGLGFDPGYSESRGEAMGASRFRVIRDFFSEQYADNQADFVCSKMTLEHISRPYDFMKAAVRVTRRPDGVVFIQVPESLRIVRDCAFEDIYYEHCSYYTAGSLSRLFRRLGLNVVSVDIAYDDQYLTVEAKYSNTSGSVDRRTVDDLGDLKQYLATFNERTTAKIDGWRRRVQQWAAAGKRIVIWGSGSKGVSFLHALGDEARHISNAVDINPYREGYFMPGTGHEIVGPKKLAALKPDAVVVMNRIYVPEIREALKGLQLNPEIDAL